MADIAIEYDHLLWIFPLKMVIFHSYVKLPEGTVLVSLGFPEKNDTPITTLVTPKNIPLLLLHLTCHTTC
jgi:hypothetical protein